MSTAAAVTYRTLLRRPHVLRVFALAMAGRLGYAMISLALLFTCSRATGSFAVAALVLAVFGTSGLVMPIQARLLDRHGQRRVLVGVATVLVTVAVTASLMGAADVGARWSWCLVALTMGVSAPSLGPSMRAQWREIAADDARATAYSLDAIAEEAVFLAGPLVVALGMTVGPAWPLVAGASALIAVGVSGLATSPYRPEPQDDPPARRSLRGPLQRAGFRRLLLVMATSGFVLSLAMTAVAALADRAQTQGAMGVIEAGMGVASVVGGWVWGRHSTGLVRWGWARGWRRQIAALLAVRAPLFVAAAVYPSVWWAGTCVAVVGLSVAPTFVVGFGASDDETEPSEHTEASTWLTALSKIGSSVGTSIAGLFVGHLAWAFVLAAAMTCLGFAASIVGRRAE